MRRFAAAERHVRVDSAVKACRSESHTRVSHIGGVNPDGTRWLLRQSDAIAAINHGRWRFYVDTGHGRTDVIVAAHLGREYLKTEGDGVEPDGLLSLADHGDAPLA